VAAEDLTPRQIDNRINKIEDPQARSILSGLDESEQAQLLHYHELISEVTSGHASPQQVTAALNALIDAWRSMRTVADEVDDSLMPRLMNKALKADDPLGFMAGTRKLTERLSPADSQRLIQDIGYMVDISGPNGRVEDFVASASHLLESDLPPDLSGPLLRSAVGVSERVRLIDGINRLSSRTDDPVVLRAIADRLNGTSSRPAMSPGNRADFVEGVTSLIDNVNQLANDYPQYRQLFPDLLQGATDAHLSGNYFESVDNLLATLRDYRTSNNAMVVTDIRQRLQSGNFDPDIATIIDKAASSPGTSVSAAGESSVGKIIDTIGAADAERELGAITRVLDDMTTRSIVDPDFDADLLPPHMQAAMRDIMDKVREFNRSVGSGDIIPGDRRISQELYDELRDKTPTQAIRDRVNLDEHGKPLVPPYPDPALPGMTVTGTLHADHIVPMDTIARMDGFERLTTQQKLDILNDPRNFVGLSESANTSKGPKSFEEWTEHKASGTPVDPAFRAEMMKQEAELRILLQEEIDKLVAHNTASS
jgi:hypothetical protein